MTLSSQPTCLDLTKELGEWALAAGRHFQSEQTGYVHLYHGVNDQKAQTIPLLENALFALALFRSRLVEQVQEAKKILKALLVFQNRQNDSNHGNFPVYLHEYPSCNDPALGLQLFAPFYWTLKQFGHILGSELKQQLEQAMHLILEQCLQSHQNKPFPYFLAVRLAAAQAAVGVLWENKEWKDKGSQELERLSMQQLDGWNTTKHLADVLVGLQMIYPALSQSPWALLWERMKETWNSSLGGYAGPCVREWQEGEEPQVNLYDLFGGYFAGQFSRRASQIKPCQLHGILIQPSSDKFDVQDHALIVQGELKGQAWRLVTNSNVSYTVLEKKEPYQPTVDKTHTPFRYIWGDLQRLHSFICQGGNIEKINFQAEQQVLILDFDLRANASDQEDNSRREIEFFIDYHSNFNFRVNGQSGNTFELGQKIELSLSGRTVFLVFDLIEGEGFFFGHIMRGNRPSQIDHKGDNRFQAYDWTVFLRSIRRQSSCKIRATLTIPS